MGNTMAADTIPVLVTVVDVHNVKAQDMFYFCNVSSGGASTKVIGRSQTLSVEVGITTVLSMTVYECPEPVFTPETARVVGILRIPIERLAERYSSGIFQQWFNLDTHSDPRTPAGDLQSVVNRFEDAYVQAVADVNQPKICMSVIGSAFEVQRGARSAFSIFVGEDVKTHAGPDLKALIASHKQQAAYIDALHEELRKKNTPSYRPVANALPNLLPKPTESFMPPTAVYRSSSPLKSLPPSTYTSMDPLENESMYSGFRQNGPTTINSTMLKMHSVARPVVNETVEPVSGAMTPPVPPSMYHSMDAPHIEALYSVRQNGTMAMNDRSIMARSVTRPAFHETVEPVSGPTMSKSLSSSMYASMKAPESEVPYTTFTPSCPTMNLGLTKVQPITGLALNNSVDPVHSGFKQSSPLTPKSLPPSLYTMPRTSAPVSGPVGEPVVEHVFPVMGRPMPAN